MRAVRDATHVLDAGLAAIRGQFHIPEGFDPAVTAAAVAAAQRRPDEHRDLTTWPFVTLDPAPSTDLDQAFHIERAGDDLVLHYAIADVAWFVNDGDAADGEAWHRGLTTYLPDGKASLYPPVLAEGAASLLPDGVRPAVVFHVRVDREGVPRLDGATRAIVHSRAKLAYDTVTAAALPEGFDELAARIAVGTEARGAMTVEPPEQIVERDGDDGEYRLVFRPRLASETSNAALSLACNLAVAATMLDARVGLFRVMAEPDERAVRRLRHTAKALGINWPAEMPLERISRQLDPNSPRHASLMMAIRRAGRGAGYATYTHDQAPWHAALAAPYAHATAPLRRLADRYVVMTTLALAEGTTVPAELVAVMERLPDVMQRADARTAQIERAVIDLAEAVSLHGREGQVFDAVVVEDDDEITRVQLRDVAVVATVQMHHVQPGDAIKVRLVEADPSQRRVRFERVA